MIRRVFGATEWVRNLRAVAAPPPVRDAAAELRATAEFYATLSRTHRAQSVELFNGSSATYCRALAAECRAEAYHILTGDVHADVSRLIGQADYYDRLAGVPVPVSCVVEPIEAAHA